MMLNPQKQSTPNPSTLEKVPYLTSTGTDDADTCDERAKVHENKKQEDKYGSFCNCNEDQTANQSSDMKGFNKLPSYFMEVQENSIIFQEQHESSMKDSRGESKPILKNNKGMEKIKKKVSCTEQNALENKKKQLVYSSQIYMMQDHDIQESHAYIWDKFLCLGDRKICVHEITKLKCLLDSVSPGERKLKIIQNESQILYFAASTAMSATSISMFCDHYLWFSKLIANKIQSIKYLLKSIGQKNPIELLPPKLATENSLAKGLIYKKSQHLQNWQARFIIVTESELLSYKDINQEPTFSIRSQSMKYIWTRFDLYHGFLIIKIKHGIFKTEFAIPIVDFCGVKEGNWLYAFYRMLVHNK